MAIELLPSHLIKQIAAGECIERPASVVKELVENSLDAKATRIEVSVEDAGNRLIRVQDNGCGVPGEQLPLAITSHATSKIASSEELMSIGTLGFRGEALASISSVAELSIASCASQEGHILEAKGENISEVRPLGMARGTLVEVRNLFFNIPARRKFLKSKNVEMGHITDTVTRLALSAPKTAFQLSHNQRLLFSVAPAPDPMTRVRELLTTKNLEFFHTAGEQGGSQIEAYLGLPTHFKASNKWQYFYLNGRNIKDKVLLRALADAYRDYLPDKKHPVAVCYLKIDPDWVDVNVHPAKTEVRFRDSRQVYGLLHHTVMTGLQKREIFPEIPLLSQAKKKPASSDTLGQTSEKTNVGRVIARETSRPNNYLAKTVSPLFSGPSSGVKKIPPEPSAPFASSLPIPETMKKNTQIQSNKPETPKKPSLFPERPKNSGKQIPYLQIHNTYLLMEVPEGLALIDQHALHERILYDRLRHLLRDGKTISQPLLFPDIIQLTPQEMAAFKQWNEDLRKIGIDAKQSGRDQISVKSLPQIFGKVSASDLLIKLLEQLEQTDRVRVEEMLSDRLASMACKAAVKAGDDLSLQEIISLVSSGEMADNPYHCPHGRPTVLKITLKELEKFFHRR